MRSSALGSFLMSVRFAIMQHVFERSVLGPAVGGYPLHSLVVRVAFMPKQGRRGVANNVCHTSIGVVRNEWGAHHCVREVSLCAMNSRADCVGVKIRVVCKGLAERAQIAMRPFHIDSATVLRVCRLLRSFFWRFP